ncbi:MAG TPA: rhodanese-like domain-containing protein [Anaerolineales bacterium]|nr:rhodanese-like domain-containing protein [Anaerolineales bacterium]
MSKARVVGPRIEVEAAKTMLDSGEGVILDVIASHIWPSMARTIPGAIRIPPEEIEQRFHELPRDKTIITYCT